MEGYAEVEEAKAGGSGRRRRDGRTTTSRKGTVQDFLAMMGQAGVPAKRGSGDPDRSAPSVAN